jgi:hypothetical protein
MVLVLQMVPALPAVVALLVPQPYGSGTARFAGRDRAGVEDSVCGALLAPLCRQIFVNVLLAIPHARRRKSHTLKLTAPRSASYGDCAKLKLFRYLLASQQRTT